MINDKYMNAVKDEYKQSYTLYQQGKGMEKGWSNHQPVLIHVLNTIKTGHVLEFGMGWNSTPLMSAICKVQNRILLSVDTERKWLDKFLDYESGKHRLVLITPEEVVLKSHALFQRKYSVAFIDGSTKLRNALIRKIKDQVDYFVVHDTEERAKEVYKFDFSGFKHVLHLDEGADIPRTSLLSNLDEIDENIYTMKSLKKESKS